MLCFYCSLDGQCTHNIGPIPCNFQPSRTWADNRTGIPSHKTLATTSSMGSEGLDVLIRALGSFFVMTPSSTVWVWTSPECLFGTFCEKCEARAKEKRPNQKLPLRTGCQVPKRPHCKSRIPPNWLLSCCWSLLEATPHSTTSTLSLSFSLFAPCNLTCIQD